MPDGETCQKLAEAAKQNEIAVVGGSMPEIDKSDGTLYNTCSVFDSTGKWLGKFRKMHPFNVNIPGKIVFRESDAVGSGNSFLSFQLSKY